MQDIWRLVAAPNPVLDDVVRDGLLVQSAQASRLSSLLGLPLSVIVLAAMTASGASGREIGTWTALVLLVMLLYVAAVGRFVVRGRGDYRERLRIFTVAQTLGGTVWGLLPVLVTPVDDRTAIVSVSCSVTTLAVAANVVFSSATPLPWLGFHLAALTVGSAGLLRHGEGAVAALNALTVLAAFPLARYMYQQVARSRLVARQNALLAEDLRAEREAVERINLELSEANTELRHQATRDPLTRLPNRSLFFDHLVRSMRHGRRNGTPVAVVYFDLDRFKAINDTLGHGAGDDLLIQVAERTSAVLRSPDVLARLGGDEFVVLTHDYESGPGSQVATEVAERIREVLAVPFDLSGNPVTISGSLGVAIDETGLGAEDLVERADMALYRAKQQGRNRVALYAPELNWLQPGVES
ncbi:GGDEF domain-containing protein [Kineosporia succinea]|uniref:Diguanylate cyclase (GGDEF)-like protein n=1 Tax=Kineosporia succinea TaxID=84632 RepID=A0ABT9P7D1_9ACTN|nr:GGDEF domain-containing protein [Kineosporia succinea]MDP9828578.1 diguanylate cyclase (GGDEF)-like protein [Kineosporia succinea]